MAPRFTIAVSRRRLPVRRSLYPPSHQWPV